MRRVVIDDTLFFAKIYLIFKEESHELLLNKYCYAMMPFCYESSQKSKSFSRIRRYLFDYWDKNGKLEEHERAFKKLSAEINSIDINSGHFRQIYRNNTLVEVLKNNQNISDNIIRIVQYENDNHHINAVPIKELRSCQRTGEYARFLFIIIKHVICDSIPLFTGQIELLSRLDDYKITPEELLEHSKSTLTEIGNNETYSLLSILRKAGFPGSINRDCDHITLLKAADIYYFHRLTKVNKKDSRDIEYSYAYSKTAYEEWNSPLAAWNMGYIWYLHETYDPLSDTNIYIPEFSEVEQTEETFLLKATELFIYSARRNLPDAFTSLGNICDKALNNTDNWKDLISKLYEFTKSFVEYSNRHTPSDSENLFKAATPCSQLEYCRELLYEQAAFLGSFNGKLNYYNLIIKKMMPKTAKISFDEYSEKNRHLAQRVKEYIEDLCSYRIPAALTDAATLSLHMHPLNEWLEKSDILINGKHIKRDTKYELVFPYYECFIGGRSKAIEQLKLAADMSIPALQTPWPYYYLAKLCIEDGLEEEALKYAQKANSLRNKLGNSTRAEDHRKKITALLESLNPDEKTN